MPTQKKKLIIVESPAKARTISRFLGKNYKVEASQGHVRDLPKSQLGVDVSNDFEPKYITIRGRGDILAAIRKEAKNASQIFLATDPDREGEAISWHLGEILGLDMDKANRIEFHEVTKKAVQAAVKNPRKVDMDRVDAQQARRVLDRLVGYKISPLLWAKVKKGLSAGRVQSVATQMVVAREEEIEAFIPEEYWEISAQGRRGEQRFLLRLYSVDGVKPTLSDGAAAEKVLSRIRSSAFRVTGVKKTEKHKNPTAPFTTSTLQQEASRKLNFSTSKTMQVVQQLYEGVDLAKEGTQGLVTYIRTDSVRVSDEALAAVRQRIQEKYGEDCLPATPNVYKGRANAQDAHEAIRPTEVARTPESVKESLTGDQYKLYRLIYNRFVASQMTPAVYEAMTAEAEGGGVALRFYGERKVFSGYTLLYEESTDEAVQTAETTLPALKEGDAVSVEEPQAQQRFTQPPPRYTEASLVRTMEEKGIGRPSTYAPTISTIISRGYVSKEQKRLYPTELGRMVNGMMEEYFAGIINTEFTAELETELDAVEEGQEDWKQVIRDFYPPFEKMLTRAESEIEKIEIKDEVSDEPCEKCGAMLVYKMGRYGRFLACPNFPECRFTKPLVTYIAAPCPKCGARLMEKTSKKNRRFYGCERYPECDFVSWDKPVEEKCPQCGSYMTEKRGRGGEVWHLCANETCRYKVEAPASSAPEDGDE